MDNQLLNPFPGLRPFEENEDHLFFGREKQVDELLQKLAKTRFLAIVGASGSGKSSLVRSGLITALHSGYLTDAGTTWRVAIFRPGTTPIHNFAKSLGSAGILYDHNGKETTQKVEAALRDSSMGMIEAYKASTIPPQENLLIVVDQFEELFRFRKYEQDDSAGRQESITFVNLLLTAAAEKEYPIYVVVVMRSDFLGDCTAFRGLPEAINQGQYLIPRMTRNERREAISGPVAVGGAQVAPRLLTRLLNDVGNNPDQLPILQHALMRTWYYWENKTSHSEPLDLHHYEAIGTLSEALSLHAEEAYADLRTERERRICEIMFKALTEKGLDTRGVRRPTKLHEICALADASEEEVIHVIEVFRQSGRSFLMPPAGTPLHANSIIDISHESLMRIWNRLVLWVDEEAQAAESYIRLAEAAALYQEGRSGIWRNPELQLAVRWQVENKPTQIWANRYNPSFERAINFLEFSKEQEEFELTQKERAQRAEIRRIRIFAGVVGSAGILAFLTMIFAFFERDRAARNAQVAQEQTRQAIAQKTTADSLRIIGQQNLVELQTKEVELSAQFSVVSQQKSEIEKRGSELKKSLMEVQTANDSSELRRKRAMAFAEQANRARLSAEEANKQAQREKEEKEQQRKDAELAKSDAIQQREITERLKQLAESKALANKVFSLLGEDKRDAAINLAVYAFHMNTVYDGPVQSADNYAALKACIEEHYKTLDKKDNRNGNITWHNRPIKQLCMTPHKRILASLDVSGNVMVWMPNSDLHYKINAAKATAITFSPDGQYLFVGDATGKIQKWLIGNAYKPTGDPILLGNYGEPIQGISATTSEDIEMMAFCTPTKLYAGDAITGVFTKKAINNIRSVAYSASGKYLLIATDDKCTLFRPDYNQLGAETMLNASREIFIFKAVSVALSPDDKWLAIGGDKGSVWVMNEADFARKMSASSGSTPIRAGTMENFRYTEHTGKITNLAFNRGGSQLASSSEDGTLRIWATGDAATPIAGDRIVFRLGSPLNAAVFERQEKYVFTGGASAAISPYFSSAAVIQQELCALKFTQLTKDEFAAILRVKPDPKVLSMMKDCGGE